MTRKEAKDSALVSRISISLQPALLEELDHMVESSGYGSRSQAISDMVNYQLVEHKRKVGNDVMVGTLTLIYDRMAAGLQKRLADLQYEHIDEVISSLHVALTHNQIMEVILLQGPADLLQTIANEMIVQRGVITGHLQLMAAIIPPLHAASDKR
jgi:CopG family nickel-responsive transcriptional regulator